MGKHGLETQGPLEAGAPATRSDDTRRARRRGVLGALAAFGGAALLAGLVYLPIWLHRDDPPPPTVTKRPESVVLADVPDATLVGRHAGHKIWQIHAGRILAAADGLTTTFIGVDRGTLFRDDAPAARVAAGRAVYRAGTRTLSAEDVRLSAGGVTIHATRLRWAAVSGVIANPRVEVTWAGGVASAKDLTADTHLKTVTGRDVTMAARMEGEMFEKVARRIGAASGASLALFLSSVAPGGAAPAATAPAGAAAAPVRYREVRVRGDVWRYNQATRTHLYTGNIVATHGDTTLHADRIAYNEADNTATVTGHIRVDNPRNHVEGESADVDFNSKVIRLRGPDGVKIIALPKPGAASTASTGPAGAGGLRGRVKDPVTLACRAIEYNYRAKTAIAEGPVKVTRKDQVVTGDSATYNAAEDLISLTGNVHGKDEKNQTFDAPALKVSLQEGAEWMEATDVKATFFVKDDETPAG